MDRIVDWMRGARLRTWAAAVGWAALAAVFTVGAISESEDEDTRFGLLMFVVLWGALATHSTFRAIQIGSLLPEDGVRFWMPDRSSAAHPAMVRLRAASRAADQLIGRCAQESADEDAVADVEAVNGDVVNELVELARHVVQLERYLAVAGSRARAALGGDVERLRSLLDGEVGRYAELIGWACGSSGGDAAARITWLAEALDRFAG